MLKKMVDGIEVICSAEEEKSILKFRELNKKYPEYMGHLSFDGASNPFHILEDCKVTHKDLITTIIQEKLQKLRDSIEEAEENGEDTKELILHRKKLKSSLTQDLSPLSTFEDLYQHLETIKQL